MKKFLTIALCALVFAMTACFAACAKKDGESYSVYAPDGAPALALAEILSGDKKLSKSVDCHIVTASTISSFVTYEDNDKNADLIIMPVNLASKLLGSGEKYKMLGSVTNGNLYIVSAKGKTALTAENFATEITGKKVGVVQLSQFPGVMFKTLLKKYNATATLTEVEGAQVSGATGDSDYYVIPEPAATTRVGNANNNLQFAGDLQTLYGDNGYPQAVLLAKNSLIESDSAFVDEFVAAIGGVNNYLKTASADSVLNAIKSHYADPHNTTPAFNNLSSSVIENCKIQFRASSACKDDVKALLSEFISVDPSFAKTVDDGFFRL